MINKPKIILFVALALLLYLLLSNIGRLDLAPNKMDTVVKMNKYDIRQMQSIDSVKLEAFQLMDDFREDTKRRSKTTSIHIYILLGLIATQILLLKMTKNDKKEVHH